MKRKEKAFITGVAGMIGSHLLDILLKTGRYSVAGFLKKLYSSFGPSIVESGGFECMVELLYKMVILGGGGYRRWRWWWTGGSATARAR